MEKDIDWLDLYIKDFGGSQITDKKELANKQKKMRTLYLEFLIPLYKPIQNNKKFKFSVPDEELTCRIMYEDLKKYHQLFGMREVLYKIAENKPTLTNAKVEKLIEAMHKQKDAMEAKSR